MSDWNCFVCDRDARGFLAQVSVGAVGEHVDAKDLPPDTPEWVLKLLERVPASGVICLDCIKAGAIVINLDVEVEIPAAAAVPEHVRALPAVAAALAEAPPQRITPRAALAARVAAQNQRRR